MIINNSNSIYFYLNFSFSDDLFKIVMIGDSGVGKSCILLRFVVKSFIILFMLLFSNLMIDQNTKK